MSWRFSRLNCPAKQPHIFESCIQVQTRNVIIFIPIHCVHYLPVRFKPAPNTINCRSTRYNTMSCLANLDISHMTPPFNRFDPESLQPLWESSHDVDGPPVSSTGRSSLNCCFNCAGYGKLASGTHCASSNGYPYQVTKNSRVFLLPIFTLRHLRILSISYLG